VTSASRKAILFDLDGTLTDPFEGITRSVQYALERMGREAPPQETLRWMIGPPLRDSFPILLDTADDVLADTALRLYRERYDALGKFENRLIDGIPEVLASLKADGYFLSVATSKLNTFAREIVAHFGLDRYFDAQHGAGQDGRNSHKPDLIRHILGAEGLDPRCTIMVGDRSHDALGASANGVACIGVLWGFGDRAELEASGVAAIAERPEDLPGLIEASVPPAR